MHRIPGSRLLISGLPGLASRTHVESLGKARDSTKFIKAMPDKLDIKGHQPSILSIWSNCVYDNSLALGEWCHELCFISNIAALHMSSCMGV